MAKYKKRKDGRYETTIQQGFRADGKPNKFHIYGKTIAEIDEKILQIKINGSLEKAQRGSDLVADYCSEWLRIFTAKKSKKTQDMYAQAVASITSELGFLKMSELRRSDVQALINKYYEKPRTCQILRMTFRQIVKAAIDDDILVKDITQGVSLPAAPKPQKRALTDLEKQAVESCSLEGRELAFVYLIYYCGLRKEEALGLMASDFNFKNKTLSISRALQVGSSRAYTCIKATKNASSVRVVPLPDASIPVLREFVKNSKQLYIFANENGELMTLAMYRAFWNRIVKGLNAAVCSKNELKLGTCKISGLTAHLFRHNYATVLYYSGISMKRAAELLGHSDTKMIMQVYAHLDEARENSAEKINLAFESSNSRQRVVSKSAILG